MDQSLLLPTAVMWGQYLKQSSHRHQLQLQLLMVSGLLAGQLYCYQLEWRENHCRAAAVSQLLENM